jgi:hypothetical protein
MNFLESTINKFVIGKVVIETMRSTSSLIYHKTKNMSFLGYNLDRYKFGKQICTRQLLYKKIDRLHKKTTTEFI